AFMGFSFMASSIYVINDLKDAELDRSDSRKKHRPIASGKISTAGAVTISSVLFFFGMTLSFFLGAEIIGIFGFYFLMNIFYTYLGKKIIIVDVMTIALGYVLRVLVGAFVIDVEASPWLLSTTFFISLFLGFYKRYYEVKTSETEFLLGGIYIPETLRSFSNVTAALSIMNYSIYTILGPHSEANLIWTVPLVVLGIFRYYVLMQTPEEVKDGNPSDILLNDKFIILTILLWVSLCAFLILYFQPAGMTLANF
ncbi:MAG: UbiA prenyltransferase family protein, partial [Spirochaetia bacterium]|nr:UbiA prenyltransferase family protein [Spirochaetia bacterium]